MFRTKVGQLSDLEDVNMTDFRDITHFFSWFGFRMYQPSMSPLLAKYPIQPIKPAIMGVVVRCTTTAEKHGGRYLERVMVDAFHPVRGIYDLQPLGKYSSVHMVTLLSFNIPWPLPADSL